MFKKVLIANRGEIAVRVQQTLHTMGVATVAVYSDPDATAPHVAMADEAYALEGNAASETYLDIDKLLDVAKKSGVEAVHPGYGFLSENPAFVRACHNAGLIFIGPTPESMELLGDKVRSKELAQQIGVPVSPSFEICNGHEASMKSFVTEAGFPLLVKAAAGGGGRGIRLVTGAEHLSRAIEAASKEAHLAFGDGRVFLERYIAAPRHIEFQILADTQGNVIHLFERECSVQRRHQKIIEETPSPAMTPSLRQRMGEAAVTLSRAAGYVNAGTVEFLLDANGEFYFLEMNTRLQVEHPITEAVTGIDLVEWQARIAIGEELTLSQENIRANGHAVECRIYAEDPYNEFMPSTGTLQQWRPPGGPGLRLDSGFVAGQTVTEYYDPMLAKLIVWGQDRDQSLRRMNQALRRYMALGVITNIPFLREVVAHPKFHAGEYDTGFLEEYPELFESRASADLQEVARALAAHSIATKTPTVPSRRNDLSNVDASGPWKQVGPWRMT